MTWLLCLCIKRIRDKRWHRLLLQSLTSHQNGKEALFQLILDENCFQTVCPKHMAMTCTGWQAGILQILHLMSATPLVQLCSCTSFLLFAVGNALTDQEFTPRATSVLAIWQCHWLLLLHPASYHSKTIRTYLAPFNCCRRVLGYHWLFGGSFFCHGKTFCINNCKTTFRKHYLLRYV